MSFRGSGVHTINESGRISVPSKIRDVLKKEYNEEALVLVPCLKHPFIYAYPVSEWEKYDETLKEASYDNEIDVVALRRLRYMLDEVTIDKQGRILISPGLREYANLNGECVILGSSYRIEIWDKGLWDAEMTKPLPEDAQLGKQFNPLLY